MTKIRSIAFICFCFLFFSVVSGQSSESAGDSTRLTPQQFLMIQALATDSINGELNIPNVFTPNGDGINDHFSVTTDGTTVYEFTVFERTGTRIYHSLSPRIFWDGKNFAGTDVPEGIYYYVVDEPDAQEPNKKAGFMHLFR